MERSGEKERKKEGIKEVNNRLGDMNEIKNEKDGGCDPDLFLFTVPGQRYLPYKYTKDDEVAPFEVREEKETQKKKDGVDWISPRKLSFFLRTLFLVWLRSHSPSSLSYSLFHFCFPILRSSHPSLQPIRNHPSYPTYRPRGNRSPLHENKGGRWADHKQIHMHLQPRKAMQTNSIRQGQPNSQPWSLDFEGARHSSIHTRHAFMEDAHGGNTKGSVDRYVA